MSKTSILKRSVLLGVAPLILFLARPDKVAAAAFTKADNTTALNLAASWTNNAVPGSADTAVFDGTFSVANNNANLGGPLTWVGILVSNNLPSAFTINATGTNALTVMAGGLNLTNANQDLTINAPYVVGANQFWDFTGGRTLTFNGPVQASAGSPGNGNATRGLGGVNGAGAVTLNFRNNVTNTSSEMGPFQNYDYVINVDPVANGGSSFVDKKKLSLGKFNNNNVTMNILSGTNYITPNDYIVIGDGNTTVPAGINAGPGNGTLNILGGVTTITNSVQPIVIGVVGKGTINVNNASLILGSLGQQIRFGGNNTASQPTIAPVGILNITNHATVEIIPSSGNSVVLGYTPTGTGIINLYSNSTLICARQMYARGAGYFNFYGGTIKVPAQSTLSGGVLLQNSVKAFISAGGATIDDGGTNLLINTTLQHDSSVGTDGGFVKLGAGIITFNFDPTAYTVYNGSTVISNGTLQIPALGLDWGDFTVKSSATLAVKPLGSYGNPAVLTSLTLNSGSSLNFDEALTNAAPGVGAPLLYAKNSITTAGTVTINVTNATFNAPGQYALMNYGYFGGDLAGAGFGAFQLGNISVPLGYSLSLSNNVGNGTIDLVVSQISSVTWDGTTDNVWDINTTPNWKAGQNYTDGLLAVFDDTLTGVQNTNLVLNVSVNPNGMLFNNNAYAYGLSGSGGISGTNIITIQGGGKLTLANTNPVTGTVYVTSGTLQLGDGLSKNGTVAGSIVNNGALVVANPNDQTFTSSITGAGTFTKNNNSALILAATNNFASSTITVNAGVLSNSVAGGLALAALNLGGTLNSRDQVLFTAVSTNPINLLASASINTPAVVFQPNAPARLDCNLGTNLTLTISNQITALEPTLPNNILSWFGRGSTLNTYGGMTVGDVLYVNGLTWNANLGTNIAIIAKMSLGRFSNAPAILNFNSGTMNLGGAAFFMSVGDSDNNPPPTATGTYGAINVNGGVVNISAATRYLIGAGGLGLLNVPAGQVNFAGNGSSIMLGGDTTYAHHGATGILTVSGTGAVTVSNGSGGLRLGSSAAGATNITGILNLFGGTFTTWPGIRYGGTNTADSSGYVKFSGGTLKAGTNQAGFLQGLTAATISTNGAIIDDSGYAITIGQSLLTDANLSGVDGGLVKRGAGTLILTNLSTYTGNTVVSNGTLQVNGGLAASPVTVVSGATLSGVGTLGSAVTIKAGGSLVPGTNGPGILSFNSNLTLNGSLTIAVNKSLALSNSTVVVAGVITNGGVGVITITNLGPDLVAGDTFKLFNQPVLNGGALSIVSTNGATWVNHLAVDGSIQMSAATVINPLPGTIQVSVSVHTLSLSWPTNLGWILEAQTNQPPAGLGTNWVPVLGSESMTNYSISADPANGSVFYRLVHP